MLQGVEGNTSNLVNSLNKQSGVQQNNMSNEKFQAILNEVEKGDMSAGEVGGLINTSTGMSNAQYLQLQNAMQKQTQLYNTISNIMKARHQAAQTAIQNIK